MKEETDLADIPATLVIHSCALSGSGDRLLFASDGDGETQFIGLSGNWRERSSRPDLITGDIHVNGREIPLRSDEESALIKAMRCARYDVSVPWPGDQAGDRPGEDNRSGSGDYLARIDSDQAYREAETKEIKDFVADFLNYVESDKYVQDVRSNSTQYTRLMEQSRLAQIESELRLQAVGPNRIQVMKILRETLKISIADVAALAKEKNSLVLKSSMNQTLTLQRELVDAGASTTLTEI